MVNAVVDREAVADVLEDSSAGGARDQAEARNDQPLEEDLHEEDLLLEQVELVEEHTRELVQVGVALGGAADLAQELEPGLDVA